MPQETENNPVFIHSLFRTGSTYIWNKFRQNNNYYCYYEPFHQELVKLSKDRSITWGFDQASTKWMKHPNLDFDHMEEYKKLIPPNHPGIPYFKKSFSFDDYCRNDDHPSQKQYLEYLIKHAEPHKAVLQFNRSSLRIKWFKKEYANALHIYLLRDPRQQFQSYIEMISKKKLDTFLTMDLLTASNNQSSDFFRLLGKAIPLIDYHHDQFEYEKAIFSNLLPFYTDYGKYIIFYYIWFLAFIENILTSDIIILMDLLSSEPLYRKNISNTLTNKYQINGMEFEDVDITVYQDLIFNIPKYNEVETMMRSLVLKRYSIPQIQTFIQKLPQSIQEKLCITENDLIQLRKKRINFKNIKQKCVPGHHSILEIQKNNIIKNMDYYVLEEKFNSLSIQADIQKREIQQKAEIIGKSDTKIAEHKKMLETLSNEINQKDQKVREIKSITERYNNDIKQLKNEISETRQISNIRKREIDQLKEELKKSMETISDMQHTIHMKQNELIQKHQLLHESRELNEKKAERINSLSKKFSRSSKKLETILNSRQYRTGKFLLAPLIAIQRKISKKNKI